MTEKLVHNVIPLPLSAQRSYFLQIKNRTFLITLFLDSTLPSLILLPMGFAGVLHLLLFCLIPFAAQGGGGGGGAPSVELWCVAKNNAEDQALQSALDWACGPGRANCSPIQNGGPCYDLSNLPRMASFAFNDYYINNGLTDDSCSFSNTAALTSLNPSYGNCKFPSSFNKGNVNLNGSVTAGSDMSASNSISRRWDWGSISILLCPLVIL